jgi:YfiR/HmsC-like
MAVLRRLLRALLWCTLATMAFAHEACGAEAPTEYQVKAVFVFNFARFVEWPPQAFAAPNEPFVIGIVGPDPFGARLDEAVRGEQVGEHPLQVRRFRTAGEIGPCQILYIDRSEGAQLSPILAALNHRPTLTVTDLDGAAQHGAMIQFVTESSRIRLRINVEAARAAGLTISSKLLRPAEIVATEGGG